MRNLSSASEPEFQNSRQVHAVVQCCTGFSLRDGFSYRFSIITIFSPTSTISWSHVINLINGNYLIIRQNAVNNLEVKQMFIIQVCRL